MSILFVDKENLGIAATPSKTVQKKSNVLGQKKYTSICFDCIIVFRVLGDITNQHANRNGIQPTKSKPLTSQNTVLKTLPVNKNNVVPTQKAPVVTKKLSSAKKVTSLLSFD